MTLKTGVMMLKIPALITGINNILQYINIKTVILNCNNISQYYSFYCKNDTNPKLLDNSVTYHFMRCILGCVRTNSCWFKKQKV